MATQRLLASENNFLLLDFPVKSNTRVQGGRNQKIHHHQQQQRDGSEHRDVPFGNGVDTGDSLTVDFKNAGRAPVFVGVVKKDDTCPKSEQTKIHKATQTG